MTLKEAIALQNARYNTDTGTYVDPATGTSTDRDPQGAIFDAGYVPINGMTPDSKGAGKYASQGTLNDIFRKADPGGRWVAPNTDENPSGEWLWWRSPQYNYSLQQLNGGEGCKEKIGPLIPLAVLGAAGAAGAFGAAGAGAGAGGGVAGAFDAAGSAGLESAFGIGTGVDTAGGVLASDAGLSGVGAAGGASQLPDSYWNMLADNGGATSDAAPAGAGSFPSGTGGAFDASGMGTGVDAGTMASNAGLGSGVTGAVFPSVPGPTLTGGGNLLSSIGGLSNLGSLASGLGGIAQAVGANQAANTAANAANRASDTQLSMFNTINQQQAPYRQAGYSSLGSILGGFGLGPSSGGVSSGQFSHQFGPEDLHSNLAPNYDFVLNQGLGAVRNQMNRTGGQYSGNTLKAINDYAMNFADNSYQNAFNNYNANQTNIFNRLSNIAGLGQTANQTTANAGTTAAGNAGNAMIAGGQAQAAGNVGVANALTNAGNNAMGWYALPQLLAFSGSANG